MRNFNRAIRKIRRKLFKLLFNSHLYSKLTNREHAICLGDSHIRVFNYIQSKPLLNKFLFDIVVVGGATAQGIINPNSKTNALKVFNERIKKAKLFQTLIFQLGEVDCGFVIWYYSEKYSVSVSEQLKRSINNYTELLTNIKNKGFKKIIVISAPLPTILDGQDWGEIANERKEVKASQKERTLLTIKYNFMLKQWCMKNNIRFLDLTDELLDEDTGLINMKFLHTYKLNHHLDDEKYARLLCQSMNE